MGIPFAWLADRGSRRNLILVAIMFWSAMTAACGMANSFADAVPGAESASASAKPGLSPAAYSMIADSFPPERRARALGVYAIGAIIGVGLAFIIGGVVIQWANAAPPVTLPLVGELKTWQLAFFVVALPGPLLVLAMLPLREPRRHEKAAAVDHGTRTFGSFLGERWLVFTLLATGYSLIGVSIAAYMMWAPAFMMRSYGWPIARVGAVYGSILLVFSTSGIMLGGWWVDRLVGKGIKDALDQGHDCRRACSPCHLRSPRRSQRRDRWRWSRLR